MRISASPTKLLQAASLLTVMALSAGAGATTVQFHTSLGEIQVNLFDTATPETVENFLAYLEAGAYRNTMIHRSVQDFVVQGGGYAVTADNTIGPIANLLSPKNEPVYSNVAGTLAMAKIAGDSDSATSQWFFNLEDNSQLLDASNGGYTVFGQVTAGMDVLEAIDELKTFNFNPALETVPMRNFNPEQPGQMEAFNAAPADFLVMVDNVVVLDASPETAAGLDPVENTLVNAPPPRRKKGGGVGFLELMLLMVAGAGFARMRNKGNR